MKIFCDALTGARPGPIERVITGKVQEVQPTPSMALEHVLFTQLDILTSIVADLAAVMPEQYQEQLARRLGCVPVDKGNSVPDAQAKQKVVIIVSNGSVQDVHFSQRDTEVKVVDCDHLRSTKHSVDDISRLVDEAVAGLDFQQHML